MQDDPNIDPELNKYPPLVAYGLDIVASATTLITTNIAAAATYLGLPPLSESVTNTLKSLTVTKCVHIHFLLYGGLPCSIAEPYTVTASFRNRTIYVLPSALPVCRWYVCRSDAFELAVLWSMER
jgi:hypothetical protein